MKLKAYRERARMSQSELADFLGVSKAAITRWEHGDRVPWPKHIRLIEQKTKGAVRAGDFGPQVRLDDNRPPPTRRSSLPHDDLPLAGGKKRNLISLGWREHEELGAC